MFLIWIIEQETIRQRTWSYQARTDDFAIAMGRAIRHHFGGKAFLLPAPTGKVNCRSHGKIMRRVGNSFTAAGIKGVQGNVQIYEDGGMVNN